MIKNICRYFKLWFNSLFFGLKGVDAALTTNQKIDGGISVNVSDECDNVFKDILNEKITQEVEEIRYTSYKVARESKKYRYIGNGNAIKKNESQLSERHGLIDESDGLSLILIQDNSLICEDVLTVLNEVGKNDNKKIFSEYTLKVKRSIFPRFLIETYVKKIVLKQSDGNYVIDLYCSKYPRQFSEKKDRAFISELIKIKNGELRNSDIFDFDELSFITANAWGVEDWFKFSFVDFEFYDIIDFDGNYIVRLGCKSNIFMENILDSVYSESAEKKYKNKEQKNNATLDFNNFVKKNDYDIENNIDLSSLENMSFSIEKK